MEEKKVAKPRKKIRKKKVQRKTTRKTAVKKVPPKFDEPIVPPGKIERALMIIKSFLKAILKLVEKKINKLKAKRLADKMDIR